MTPTPASIAVAFGCYETAWRIAMPLFRFHRRLRDGYRQRMLQTRLPQADLWIQAASGGEAHLTMEILNRLSQGRLIRVLATTNTRQGMEILTAGNPAGNRPTGIQVTHRYFPFDSPALMTKAVGAAKPRLAVLLETELWPGFMRALKRQGVSCIILNGRLSPSSLRQYGRWPGLWRSLAPEAVWAVSDADAERFRRLFPDSAVRRMPNIKFDRMAPLSTAASNAESRLKPMIPTDAPFVVLGSVRSAEAEGIGEIIDHLLTTRPRPVIGLFPRHLHRLRFWEAFVKNRRFPWCRRNDLEAAPPSGTVILWDTFGELPAAYGLADAAFVGGSLAPLGGQNFLEPLASGLAPVVGPFGEDFMWIGEDIFAQGLAHQVPDARAAARRLAAALDRPVSRTAVQAAYRRYLADRRGGADVAASAILARLESRDAEKGLDC